MFHDVVFHWTRPVVCTGCCCAFLSKLTVCLFFAVALGNLGACLCDEGKFGEAAEILREAVSIKSSLNVSPESREICESQLNN